MKKVSATLRYLRIAPRKARLVADLIRGKKAVDAQNILNFTVKGSARPMLKLLNSALANARSAYQLEAPSLYISKIEVNEGPKLKRWRARARGQAAEIQKKTSHINMILEEIKGSKKTKAAKPAAGKETVKTSKKIGETGKTPRAEKPPKEGKPPTGQAKFRPSSESIRSRPRQALKKVFRRKTA